MEALERDDMSTGIGEIFARFHRERARLEQTVDELKAALRRYSGVVLYGAGSSGIALLLALRRADIQPLCFADGAPEKWGTQCMGLEVVPPQTLTERFGANILVLVCINTDGQAYCRSFDEALRAGGHSGVHQRLREWGCTNVVDYVALRRCFALFRGDNTGNLPSCPDVDSLVEHQERIERVFERLADGLSKEIYANILTFRLFGEGPEIPTLSQEEKYFPKELFTPAAEEHFVDCGAFDGQTLRDLLALTGGRVGLITRWSRTRSISSGWSSLRPSCRRRSGQKAHFSPARPGAEKGSSPCMPSMDRGALPRPMAGHRQRRLQSTSCWTDGGPRRSR